jgi:hypothetical protein
MTDVQLTRSVFERAVAVYARLGVNSARAVLVCDESLQAATVAYEHLKPKNKGKHKARSDEAAALVAVRQEELRVTRATLQAYKDAEAAVWANYTLWVGDFVWQF